ncbi:hypothetical protein [Oceanobacillus caeni]|uniref:hypothetical protein n=1 Tax=Oceanobacillus caeni TaxID=405946 RepID=UPI0026819605
MKFEIPYFRHGEESQMIKLMVLCNKSDSAHYPQSNDALDEDSLFPVCKRILSSY